MKILFISDIHGMKTNLEKIKNILEKDNFDKLVVLGDLFYIGPRNRLSEEYDISYVKDFLETYQDKLICLKGNCDSEIDMEVCNFPIINTLGYLSVDNLDIYLTHGHIYNQTNWEKENTILIFGHYHIPFIEKRNNMIFMNPGSISLPKENNKPSYLIYENKKFTIYDIDNNIIDELKIEE